MVIQELGVVVRPFIFFVSVEVFPKNLRLGGVYVDPSKFVAEIDPD